MTDAIKHFMENLSSAKIAVIGLGISNLPLIRFLSRSGAGNITAYDRYENPQIRESIAALRAEGLILDAVTGGGYLDDIAEKRYDVIFKAPAIRPDLPQLTRAVESGALLTSEMELFFELCPCKIYGVTGSDGKTTTTTLIWKLLSAHYAGTDTKVWLGGNIGRPLIDILPEIKPDDTAVLELSSFQLMTMRKSPHVAVITNISPNHLDIHRDYAEYIDAKKNICRYQSPDDIVVLNCRNDVTKAFADHFLSEGRHVRLFPRICTHRTISIRVRKGADSWKEQRFRTFLPYIIISLTAICCVFRGLLMPKICWPLFRHAPGVIREEDIGTAAAEFYGVEHRLEFVRELRGVKYYNSAIDSSPNRTIHTLSVFAGNVVLLAGGKDKNIPYDALGPVICEKVKVLILTGPTAEKIEAAVRAADCPQSANIRIFHFQQYADAVKCAYENAIPGDSVLLSPASTSFDLFKNFEEQGKRI